LLSNALKHTKCGDIMLYSKIIDTDELQSLSIENECHVGAKMIENQSYLMFEIKDNGKGIPKNKMDKIFNEQETEDNNENWDGTGLGLPICLTLCKNMNAFIKYASTINVFTIFRL